MLINIRISELLTYTSNSMPLAIIIFISFYYSVYSTIPYGIAPFTSYKNLVYDTLNDAGLASLHLCFKGPVKLSDIESDNSVISFATTSI